MKLTLLIFLINTFSWAACEGDLISPERYMTAELKSPEELHSDKGWSILYRSEPSPGEYFKWGDLIVKNNPALKASKTNEAAGALDWSETLFTEAELIAKGEAGFKKKLIKVEAQRKAYLENITKTIQSKKDEIINRSLIETKKFLNKQIDDQLSNILEYLPSDLPENVQSAYEGIKLAQQKFRNDMSKFILNDSNSLPSEILTLIKGAEGSAASSTSQPIPVIAEYVELAKQWSLVQKQVQNRQKKLFQPTFEILDSIKRFTGDKLMTIDANHPVLKLEQKLLTELDNKLGIEIMPYGPTVKYNLDLHEAISVVPGTGQENNTLLMTIKYGYTRRGESLPLRFAEVQVAQD